VEEAKQMEVDTPPPLQTAKPIQKKQQNEADEDGWVTVTKKKKR
jgi:hypothetical protein